LSAVLDLNRNERVFIVGSELHRRGNDAHISPDLSFTDFTGDLVRLLGSFPSQRSEENRGTNKYQANFRGPSHVLLRFKVVLGPFFGALSALICGIGLWYVIVGNSWRQRLLGGSAACVGWALLNVIQNWSLGRDWGFAWWWFTGSN
jgi:hypothetical protein